MALGNFEYALLTWSFGFSTTKLVDKNFIQMGFSEFLVSLFDQRSNVFEFMKAKTVTVIKSFQV